MDVANVSAVVVLQTVTEVVAVQLTCREAAAPDRHTHICCYS